MANLLIPIGTPALTGLTARTLTSGTLSDAVALSEFAGAGGLYSGAIAASEH